MNLKLAQAYYDGSDYLRKLRMRADTLKRASEDQFFLSQKLLDVWSADPITFIEDFLFLKLPNFHNAIKPFFLFEYQKKIILKLLECDQSLGEHTLLIDKPREMGVTWTIIAYLYWRWLFTPNWSGFILSRTEAEVDDGSTSPDNSIFGKIRWLIERTPEFLLPPSFEPKGKKGTSSDMMLKIMNPSLQSSINGSTTNASAGRSRRYSLTFIDECFYIENFMSVYRSLESVSRVKVFCSSSREGTKFKKFVDMCKDKGDYISLEWKDHPWKDAEWFSELERKAEFDPEIMKEAVVSYAVNPKSQYYPQISQAKIAKVEYDKSRPLYVSMDIGRGDLTVMIWWQYDGQFFKAIECYASNNKNLEWYVPFLNPDIQYNPDHYKTDIQKKILARVRSWGKPKAYFGEQDHFKKSMASNKSCADILATYKIRLMYNQYAITYEPRRRATAAILPMILFNEDSEYVMELYDAMQSSKYANVVAPTSPQTVLKPIHEPEVADYRSALENMSVNLPRVLRLQRSEQRTPESKNLTDGLLRYMRS